MVKVNIHQHQKGKPNLSKKIFGPEATLIQCDFCIIQILREFVFEDS